MTAVFDTNILIDLLNGIPEARSAIRSHRRRAISVITWIETLVGAKGEDDDRRVRSLLSRFRVVPVTDGVRERAVAIRRAGRQKLPDAIILATARELGWVLVTRNTRDFADADPMVSVPYRL